MSWIDGISPCRELGVNGCEVWWEAWGAIGALGAAGMALAALLIAWISIGITAASAIAVWRLGTEANAASKEATRIAGVAAARREYRDETEELLVLMQVTGEISLGKTRLEGVLEKLHGGGLGATLFVTSEAHREEIFHEIERISFPVTAAAKERVHYLQRPIAGSLLRAYGMLEVTKEACRTRTNHESKEDLEDGHRTLSFLMPLVIKDLTAITRACEVGVRRLGLDDPEVVRAAAG